MSRQHTASMSSDDKNWPKLGAGKNSAPTPSKAGPTRSQPVSGASGNPSDQAPTFNKSLTGVGDQRLASGAVNNTSGNTARPTHPRVTVKSIEPGSRSISFSDAVRKGSPPPSPILPALLPPLLLLPPPTPKTTDTLKRFNKPSALTAGIVPTDSFPPLSQSPSPASVNKGKTVPGRKNSYAAATGTGTGANSKTRPLVTTGACAISTSVSESPVSTLSPGSSARVMTLNIGTVVRPATPPAVNTSPACTPQKPKRGKRYSEPSNTLTLPVPEGRTRSASVSSIATSIATSAITTSSRGPASSKTSACATPISDDLEWRLKLTELAKNMSSSQRAAWEKILRCDPKDTSKMKWNMFDKALRALQFKSQARGGSETEYTPDPEYFGTRVNSSHLFLVHIFTLVHRPNPFPIIVVSVASKLGCY
ncbi:hypothetical protein B0J17DRAFT_152507 [Rhizoctonia solani]|nr:hypothetical protein B0J17DRAFT_152507 [Rhizoctonia solani]